MKKLAGIAALIALAVPASAEAAPLTWTGCYLGANAGYGWGKEDWTFTINNLDAGNPHPHGWMGGGQAGCDYQFSPNWVAGIAGLFDWADIVDAKQDPQGSPGVLARSQIKNIADVTARLGYSINNSLWYVLGGGAWSRTERSFTTTVFEQTDWKSGWVLGGGVEILFAPRWSWKIEYNHFDFGDIATMQPAGIRIKTAQTVDTVMVGVNYRFSSPQ